MGGIFNHKAGEDNHTAVPLAVMPGALATSSSSLLNLYQSHSLRELQQEVMRRQGSPYTGKIDTCASVNISNHCRFACAHCDWQGGPGAKRLYRMKLDEIVALVQKLDHQGMGHLILQSGYDVAYSPTMIASLIERIRATTSLHITLAMGDRPIESLKLWKDAGADSYLFRFDPPGYNLYSQIASHGEAHHRQNTPSLLYDLGYGIIGGMVVGLPGVSIDRLFENFALALKNELDGFVFALFQPNAISNPSLNMNDNVETALKLVSLTRLIDSNLAISVPTPLSETFRGFEASIRSGSSLLLLDATPSGYQRYTRNTSLHRRSRLFRAVVENATKLAQRTGYELRLR